ncbi:hypothetical protein CBR_g68731 [Chara braunii]|uniref:Myb-like domain-containing protein n=1 Tax=Chara braunii TaxID=69332 RepID=A0A388K9P4_CHABU|nr:hypothetical protein CBR_g68731 [Chara braunii]|eukprot:GBG66746.1 hypothetical protein CBR_g68731 [Chara braunii]
MDGSASSWLFGSRLQPHQSPREPRREELHQGPIGMPFSGLSDDDSYSEEYYIPAAALPTQHLSTPPSRDLLGDAYNGPGEFSSLLSDESPVGRTPHLAPDGVQRALHFPVPSGVKQIDLEQPPIDMEEPQSGQQEPVASEEEEDSQKRASSDGKGSAGGQAFNSPKLKWQPIAEAIKQATGREVKKWDACTKKWRQFTGNYREIRDFMLKSGAPSYWTMSAAERKHPKIGDVPLKDALPPNFDREHFDMLDSFLGKRDSITGRHVADAYRRNLNNNASASASATATLPWPPPGDLPSESNAGHESASSGVGQQSFTECDERPKKRSATRGNMDMATALASSTDRIIERMDRQASIGNRQNDLMAEMVSIERERVKADTVNSRLWLDVFVKMTDRL